MYASIDSIYNVHFLFFVNKFNFRRSTKRILLGMEEPERARVFESIKRDETEKPKFTIHEFDVGGAKIIFTRNKFPSGCQKRLSDLAPCERCAGSYAIG